MNMKKLALTTIVCLAVLGAGTYEVTVNIYKDESATSQTNQDTEQEHSKETKYIPENEVENMKLKDINGNEVSMSEFKGKRVYVNFWATWSEASTKELNDIQKLFKDTQNTDIVVLTVVIDGTEDSIKDYLSKNKYDFKVLLDLDGRISDYNNIEQIPTSYFIDKNGELKSKRMGELTLEQIKSELDKLNEKAVVQKIGGNNNEKDN